MLSVSKKRPFLIKFLVEDIGGNIKIVSGKLASTLHWDIN